MGSVEFACYDIVMSICHEIIIYILKIVDLSVAAGRGLPGRTSGNPCETLGQASNANLLSDEAWFAKNVTVFGILVTVFSKAWDESQFLLGFSSLPPRILLFASSDSPLCLLGFLLNGSSVRLEIRGGKEDSMR
jgi:hypothetical protein